MHRMLFIIGAPRSGTTMLERMLSAHTHVKGGPEPHLLTPLAHLGVWANVDKAPYDHVLAAEAQKQFIAALPDREDTYWQACRAYCDVLYTAYMHDTSATYCLDKTPAYALVWPFITRVFPDAHYIVLTRHPVALFSSYANSFFNGDYAAAKAYNPILDRYVPTLARLLRERPVAITHLRYEDLVQAPETHFAALCGDLDIPYEAEAVAYGEKENGKPGGKTEKKQEGLGDPIGVSKHTRPTTDSVEKWAKELHATPEKARFMQDWIARLAPEDLETLGYPLETLWAPLDKLSGKTARPRPARFSRYQLQRKCIVGLRAQAQKRPWFRHILEKIRLATNVLLREP